MTEPTDLMPERTQLPGAERDFTLPMEPHSFTINDDRFLAPAILAPIKLARVAELHKSLNVDTTSEDALRQTLDGVADIFAIFLFKKSAARFRERLLSPGEIDDGDPVPVDLTRQALPALYWLMELYGLRPTQPSSLLPNDLETGDSTGGVPAAASTGEVSEAPHNS